MKLHSICEWCTAVHVLTLFTFFIALYRLQLQMSGEDTQKPVAPARSASKMRQGIGGERITQPGAGQIRQSSGERFRHRAANAGATLGIACRQRRIRQPWFVVAS